MYHSLHFAFDIDHINLALMCLLQKFQTVQIIPFEQEVIALSRSSSNLPVMILCKYRASVIL